MDINLAIQIISAVTTTIGGPILIWTVLLLRKQTSELTVQTRVASHAARASIYQSIAEQMISIDHIFLEYPDLKPYFYNGLIVLPEHTDHSRIMTIAEMVIDFMDNALVQSQSMPEYPWENTWFRYFRSLLGSSPVLRMYWIENREWYSNDLKNILDPTLIEISEKQAQQEPT